jgi:hypothetical protein
LERKQILKSDARYHIDMINSPVTSPDPARGGPKNSARRLLAAATAASLILSFIPGAELLTYPIRLFSTLVHEGGHALATVISGGSVNQIWVFPNTSGLTESLGGFGPLIYSGGYLGTAIIGAAALLMSRRNGSGRRGAVLIACAVLAVTILWVHPWNAGVFGFATGLGIAGLLLVCARLMSEPAARFLTSFLAVQLSLNALYDVRDLLHMTTRAAGENDAVFMANAYGLWPWFWAATWAIGAVVVLGATLRAYWRE